MISACSLKDQADDKGPNHDTNGNGETLSSRLPRSKGVVLAAVIAAQSKVTKLAKSSRNEVLGYPFASIDSFLELVKPICVEAGLVILMDEVSVTDLTLGHRSNQEHWLRVSYAITLAHVSGETLGPFQRHVDIPRSGPQAFGAAQSYVLKNFFRAQFQIPTAEEDDPDFGIRSGRRPLASNFPEDAQHARACKTLAEHSLEIDALVTRISEVASGRDLLAVLADIPCGIREHPNLLAERVKTLGRIVASAPTIAALERLEYHFAIDWAQVDDEATRRRIELDRLNDRSDASLPPRTLKVSTVDNEKQQLVSLASELGSSALNSISTEIPDELDFGDIPYQEALA
jgi:hypothetical protein